MTRREAWLTAGAIFVVAFLVRLVFASQIVFPKPEDTAYYVGRGAEPGRRTGPGLGRDLELPDAAARVPARGVRDVAATPDLPGSHPDAASWSDIRCRAVVVCPDRRDRAGPRLAIGRRCVRGVRPAQRSGAGPRHRQRLDGRRLPAAAASLRPPQFDDAVYGPGPVRLPADGADRRQTHRRSASRPAGHRPRTAHRDHGPHPQRGDLRRSGLDDRRLGHRWTWTGRGSD